MKYYALQVKTADEDSYIQKAQALLKDKAEFRLFFPKRRLSVRRQGKIFKELTPVFSSYVFLETEELHSELFWGLRTTPGFYRFLKSNKEVMPLEGRDLSTIKHFIGFGGIAEASKVIFDENDRIQVLEGPLKGLEGSIVKVDKRKGRAKIKLDLYDDKFLLDFAFEIIGTV